jgi:hypothetical protein
MGKVWGDRDVCVNIDFALYWIIMNAIIRPSRSNIDVFWGELSACDHSVQIYQTDTEFLDALEGFVAAGIRQGDAILLIATPVHLAGLEERLSANGFDLAAARERRQFFTFDAEETLSKFMVDGWPDEQRFNDLVNGLLADARQHYPTVRAFGEMVALMWAAGHCGATVRLEHLWSRLCMEKEFSLFCAYPKTGFTQDTASAIAEVCAAHTQVYAL